MTCLFLVCITQDVGLQSLICFIESTAGIMSPASFLISYNIVILHFVKNERSSYMHALRAYFFFFVVASSLQINLCIKLCSLYYSDCLQQKRPHQNPLSARISRGRGPTHSFLCDVKSSFDLIIKPGLNSGLS